MSDVDSQSAWGDIVGFGLLLRPGPRRRGNSGFRSGGFLPLSSNKATSTGKCELGPVAVYINSATPTWQWGVLAYHLMDAAADDSDHHYHQNQFFIQPDLVKHYG